MVSKTLFSSESDEWETPSEIFEKLNEEFGFTLDPCSTHKNAKCKRHFTIEDNGLEKSWGGRLYTATLPTVRFPIGLKSIGKNHTSQTRL